MLKHVKLIIFAILIFEVLLPTNIMAASGTSNNDDNNLYSCTYYSGEDKEFTLYWRNNDVVVKFPFNSKYNDYCPPTVMRFVKEDFMSSKCPELQIDIDIITSSYDVNTNSTCQVSFTIRKGSDSSGSSGYSDPVGGKSEVDRTTRKHGVNLEDVDCSAILPHEVQEVLKNILTFVKYAGPILVVVLTIIDLIKAAVSGDAGEMKKVSNKFIKRLIAAILLFFIPILVGIIFDFFNITALNCTELAIIYFRI